MFIYEIKEAFFMQAVLSVWDFFQKQVLGLRWLNTLIGNILQTLGMNPETKIFSTLQFFIYDSFKIFFLLSVLILYILVHFGLGI